MLAIALWDLGMSILMKAMQRRSASTAPASWSMGAAASRRYRRKAWWALGVLSILFFYLWFQDRSAPHRVLPAPTSPAFELDELLKWAEEQPEALMQRIHLAPDSLRPQREALMSFLLGHRLWSLAHALAMRLPALAPSLAERAMLAVYALEHDQDLEALRWYESLISESEPALEHWLGYAIVLHRQGQLPKAKTAFEHAWSMMSEQHPAYTFVLEQLDRLNELLK